MHFGQVSPSEGLFCFSPGQRSCWPLHQAEKGGSGSGRCHSVWNPHAPQPFAGLLPFLLYGTATYIYAVQARMNLEQEHAAGDKAS